MWGEPELTVDTCIDNRDASLLSMIHVHGIAVCAYATKGDIILCVMRQYSPSHWL